MIDTTVTAIELIYPIFRWDRGFEQQNEYRLLDNFDLEQACVLSNRPPGLTHSRKNISISALRTIESPQSSLEDFQSGLSSSGFADLYWVVVDFAMKRGHSLSCG